jgi:hypothetical protein
MFLIARERVYTPLHEHCLNLLSNGLNYLIDSANKYSNFSWANYKPQIHEFSMQKLLKYYASIFHFCQQQNNDSGGRFGHSDVMDTP